MKIRKDHYYSIPLNDLMEIFTDQHFFESRFDEAGVTDYEIEHFGEQAGKFVIKVRRDMVIKPPKQLPNVVKKLIRDKNAMITSIEWDLARIEDGSVGQYQFELEGLPGKVSGTTIVTPTAEGCVNQLSLTVSNSIPIVGKKLNSVLGEKVEKGLVKEHEATVDYIERFHPGHVVGKDVG